MKPFVWLLLGSVLVGGPLAASGQAHEHAASPKGAASTDAFKPQTSFWAVCTGVEEADLIKIKPEAGGAEEVYLLGADTPEPGQGEWTDKARAVTKALILDKRIKVVLDKQPRAHCGRLRAYVYTEGGVFLNLKLIEDGYASVLTKSPNLAHDEEFKQAEKAARSKRLGIWDAKSGLAILPGAYRKQHGEHAEHDGPACEADSGAPHKH